MRQLDRSGDGALGDSLSLSPEVVHLGAEAFNCTGARRPRRITALEPRLKQTSDIVARRPTQRPSKYFLDNNFLVYYYDFMQRATHATKKQKMPASGLTHHLGFWLRRVSNAVSHAFARKLEGQGVTVAEWVVLREMCAGDDTTSPSAVAELTGLTRGAISKLISRLLEKGLVTRRESTKDRRYQDIELTEAAVNLVPALARLADDNDEEFFGALSNSDRKGLLEILQRAVKLHNLTKLPIE